MLALVPAQVFAAANSFSFTTEGDGAADFSTEAAYSGVYSAKLSSGTADGASAGKVSMSLTQSLSSITDISFWYRISSVSTAVPYGTMNAWPLYCREGTTFALTADGYYSPYLILKIDVAGTPHWIMSQIWAEPAENLDTWIQWKMSDHAIPYGGGIPTVALWHDESFTNAGGPGTGSWPAGWGPLSFFQAHYAGATIVTVGIAAGWWSFNQPQVAYVDSLSINGIGYDIEFTTATGSGTATFNPTIGTITGLTAVSEDALPTSGKPNLTFPHAFFSFTVTGLAPGDSVTVTITLPSAVPVGTQYWKYGPTPGNLVDHWYQIPIGDDDGDDVIAVPLVDGGLGDDIVTVADGKIVDQGGPGSPSPATVTGTPVGGFLEPVNKLNVLTPYSALLGLVATVAIVVAAPWKKRKS